MKLSERMLALGWSIRRVGTSWWVRPTGCVFAIFTYDAAQGFDNYPAVELMLELHEALNGFDWHYQYSDDIKVRTAGQEHADEVRRIADTLHCYLPSFGSAEFMALMRYYTAKQS